MTAKEALGGGKLLNYVISMLTIGGIIIGGFITLRLWPIQERVSLAEGDIRTLCERTEDLKKGIDKCPTEKELAPVLEAIRQRLNEDHETIEELRSTAAQLEKIMVRIEAKIDR